MKVRNTLLNGPLGYGGAPLGNMFRNIPEEEALGTVASAWEQGIRYFDTAPFYGAGLSEIRMGKVLSKHNRDDYVLSTKVGRLILDELETGERQFGEKGDLFANGSANKMVLDYTEKGAIQSIEDSCARMGVDRIDFVWVHDIAQDFHGDAWISMLETARTGAFRALTRLCEEGTIKAWGLGVNKVEPCELALDLKEFRPNALLLAGRYTLLDHERALQRLMPKAAELGVEIIIGGPYSSGVLVGGDHFEYQKAPPEILAKVARLKALADRYEIPIKAAGLHFSLAHPASAGVIPGASKPSRIAEDIAALNTQVPDDFWSEIRAQELVAPGAPLPIDR